jgi:predicted O-linked N-acetylglucosamine transferase (SPINDLY family)
MTRPNIFQRPAPKPAAAPPSTLPAPLQQEVRRARAMHEAGQVEAAAAVYRAVLGAYPAEFDCLHYLGVAERQLGRPDAAVALLEQAIAVAPRAAAAHANLGAALLAQDRPEAALARLDAALALNAGSAEAHANRGWTLHRLGRHDEAVAALDRALALNPSQPRYHFRRASVLTVAGRLDEAREAFLALVALRPDDVQPLANLASLLVLMGRDAPAREVLSRAIAMQPDDATHRLRLAVSWLPLVRDDDDGLAEARAQFAAQTQALRALVATRPLAGPAEAVGEAQPYYLAYQDLDNRALLAGYGALCATLMQQWRDAQPAIVGPASARPRGRIRVGIVSAHLRHHSVWNAITKGWVLGLDPARFELALFHLGPRSDAETALARERAAIFVDGERALAGWVRAIREADVDVLLYPELGMDALTCRLAALRLAPVQAASWGHPQTTGLPTMDAYLSAELLEPDGADAHYTERLVRLPHLGAWVEPAPMAPEAFDLSTLGVTAGDALYVCPGTAYKYTPRHDALFVRIAQAVPASTFLLFRHDLSSSLFDRVLARLRAAFAAAGLDPDRHLRIAGWMPAPRFHHVLTQATAFLDTVGFSGFNTVLQAIDHGLPVVTQRGGHLRGRLGSGPLERLGLGGFVAADDDAYVATAARLATDAAWRDAFSRTLVARRDVLYRDPAPIDALARWIEDAVAQNNAQLPRAPSRRELQHVRPLPPASLPEGGSSQHHARTTSNRLSPKGSP